MKTYKTEQYTISKISELDEKINHRVSKGWLIVRIFEPIYLKGQEIHRIMYEINN